jgi:hypothetical protein
VPVPQAAAGDVRAGASRRGPRLALLGGRTRLVIPIQGSTADVTHYPLAAPDGVVITLHAATARLPVGNYAIHREGFRMLWVRRKGGATRLRVVFSRPGRPEIEVRRGEIHVGVAAPPGEPG